jgi:hypothetical protein
MLTRIYFGTFNGTQFVQRGTGGQNSVLLKDVVCITTNETYEQVAIPLNDVIGRQLSTIQCGDRIVMRLWRPDNSVPPRVDSFYIVPHWYKIVPLDQWDAVLNELNRK